MPDGWSLKRLGEVTVNHDARRIPVKSQDRRPGPYPYYGASGVVDYVDGFLFDGDYLLVAEDGENLRTRTTPIAFRATGKFWVNNHAHVLTGGDGNDSRFLMYALQRADISAYITGSTQPKLSQASLNRIPVGVPPEGEQRAIAGLLGGLDDMIAANRRVAQALEQISRLLFESWFVDFGPVLGRSRVPEEVRSLFPSRLVDSQIGPVPEGWQVAALGEHVEVTRGLSYTSAGLVDGGVPLHNLNSIREGGGYKEDGIKYYVGEYRDRDRVLPGDLIVANTEQGFEHLLIGYPAIVPRTFGEEGIFSQDLCRVRPREGSPVNVRWLYLLLVGHRMHYEVVGYSNGTTVNHLAMDGLKKPLIAVPPRELVHQFDEIVAPMLEQQEALAVESKTLGELRDVLLPKLMSGEIRLPVEAA